MSKKTAHAVGLVSFRERLANSKVFTDLCHEGMALVEGFRGDLMVWLRHR
jgi:hypothetical protein